MQYVEAYVVCRGDLLVLGRVYSMQYAVCSMQYAVCRGVCSMQRRPAGAWRGYAVCSMQCVEAHVMWRSDLVVRRDELSSTAAN
jgi:hypothetical protein